MIGSIMSWASWSAGMQPAVSRTVERDEDKVFWRNWVIANAFGEFVGLGIPALVGWGMMTSVGEPSTRLEAFAFAFLFIVLGGFEGAVVGLAQSAVIRERLWRMTRSSWIVASIIGAAVAWTLGMIPATVAHLSVGSNDTPPPPMSDAQQLLLAMMMGMVLGIVLGVPQWRVLRRHVSHSGWWILANGLAWTFAMPVVFLAAGSAPPGLSGPALIGLGLAAITLAGAVAGAIHGAFLVRLTAIGD